MTVHLSPQQIADWLIGEQDKAVADHLSQCFVCQAEVSRMRRVLGGFRTGVRDWSKIEGARAAVTLARPAPRLATTYWVAAGSAMTVGVIALCVIFSQSRASFRTHVDGASAAGTPTSETGLSKTALIHDLRDKSVSDSELLQQVHMQLLQTAPGPMQPLYGSVLRERLQ